ncbi:MAG TPA: hypothetical protein DCW42_09335 [Bacteroidetes bacterium]|nr:hypothetical protein [Bacteroidota bacterium]
MNAQNEDQIQEEIIPETTFYTQLDYYWKSLALYAICLSIVTLIRQTVSQYKLIAAVYQPVILILAIIVLITTLALLYQIYLKREVVISQRGIKVSRRGFERFYPVEHISKIIIREKLIINNNRNNYLPVIIRLKNNRKVRINPVIYKNDKELLNLIIKLKDIYKL